MTGECLLSKANAAPPSFSAIIFVNSSWSLRSSQVSCFITGLVFGSLFGIMDDPSDSNRSKLGTKGRFTPVLATILTQQSNHMTVSSALSIWVRPAVMKSKALVVSSWLILSCMKSLANSFLQMMSNTSLDLFECYSYHDDRDSIIIVWELVMPWRHWHLFIFLFRYFFIILHYSNGDR